MDINDVIDSEDEKEDVFQTAAAVTDYTDFWNLFQSGQKEPEPEP